MSEELARYKAWIAGLYYRAASSYGRVGPAFFEHAESSVPSGNRGRASLGLLATGPRLTSASS